MVLGRAILLVALLGLVSARCPTVTCETLSENMCAQQTGPNAYSVNSDGCNSDSTCSMTAYLAVLAITATSTGGTTTYNSLSCQTSPSDSTSTLECKPVMCETKFEAKNWSNGGTLLLCQTDSDCLMQDGTWSTCVCVPREDKNGVCAPHHSNIDVFAGYWTNCGLNNVMAEEVSYNFWSYALNFWTYMQSDVSCNDIFYELAQYDSLYSDYEAAEVVGISAVVGLLFLD